jgi:hypothetical protein
MSYGELKIDTITFTAGGVDTSVSVSGLVQNPTFTGNITTTGTISGVNVIGTTEVSGATVTGDVGLFENLTAVSGVFTTQVSGATVTGDVGLFTTITGGIHTLTSGVFASGTAANPSITFVDDLDTGLFTGAANTVSLVASGAAVLTVSGTKVGVGTNAPSSILHIANSESSVGGAFIDARNSGTGEGLLISSNTRGSADNATAVLRVIDRNGTDALRVNVEGNVGIGTSEPSSLLEVRDDAIPRLSIRNVTTTSFSQLLFSEVGDSSNFVINRLGSTSTAVGGARAVQIWQEADAPIVFATDNAEKIRINGDGRLLVGATITFSQEVIGATGFQPKIQVNSAAGEGISIVGWRNTNNYPGFLWLARSNSDTIGTHALVASGQKLGQILFSGSDGTDFENGASISAVVDGTPGADNMPTRLEFATTPATLSIPAERMRITSDGRVSIGNTSPENTWRLQVAGSSLCALLTSDSSAASPMYGGVIVDRTSKATNDGTGIGFNLENSSDNRHEYAYIGGVIEDNTDTSEDGGIIFAPTLAGNRTEVMRIDEVGRILMGRTAELSSVRGIQMYNTSPYFLGCKSDNNPANDAILCALSGFSQSGATFAESGYVRIEAGSNVSSGFHYGRIRFGTTKTGTSPTSVGEFDLYGNFYVGPDGDYSDSNYGQTTGNGNFMYSRDTGSARGTIIASNNADRGWSLAYLNKFAYNSGDDDRFIAWYINGSSTATISWNGSAIVYGTTSDYRRKINPSTYTGGLEKVKQLHVREFDWLEFPEADRTVGFFAHELQEIFPQAVTGVKDGMRIDEFTGEEVPAYQEVDYGKITPLLAAALQEAIAKIETLEAKVAALEAS